MKAENTEKDHSIRSYLRRRTTEQLDEILLLYLQQEVCTFNKNIILTILDVLKEREKDKPYTLSPELLALYERIYGRDGF